MWPLRGRAAGQGMVFVLSALIRVYNLRVVCRKQKHGQHATRFFFFNSDLVFPSRRLPSADFRSEKKASNLQVKTR